MTMGKKAIVAFDFYCWYVVFPTTIFQKYLILLLLFRTHIVD